LNQQTQSFQHFLVALFAALWIHVGLIFLIILLLIFDVLAGKEIVSDQADEEPPPNDDFSELVLSFEEDPPLDVVAVEEKETAPDSPTPEPREKFARTRDDQMSDAPIKAEFIGERDTKATSDSDAVAGDRKSVALSGEEKERNDNQTFDSNFSDGDASGDRKTKTTSEEINTGEDPKTEDSSEGPSNEMKPDQDLISEDKSEEFVDIDGVIKTIEDVMAEEKKAPEIKPEVKPQVKVVEKKKAASRDGGFNSQTSKTRVRGVLSAKGIGALDVKNSAVGVYGSQIFKEIEREWQMGNYKYRSLIAPGQISLYFVIDKKGNVSRQRQVEMRGASGTQWGIVLNSVTAAKIPPMPKEVIKELGGENLELTMGFTYN